MKAIIENRITELGEFVLDNLNGLGDFINFTMKTIFWTFKPPYRVKLLFDQIHFMGNKSALMALKPR